MTRILLIAVMLWTLPVRASQPDLVLKGHLTNSNHQTYIQVPFDVPQQTQRITVKFDYSGKQERSVIDLGLTGPDGRLLGWSGGNKSEFTISAVDATPSYIPTPIHAGRWHLLLGIPNLRKMSSSDYEAHIFFSKTLGASDEPDVISKPLKAQAGWYRGDFHAHTAHSDGSCNRWNSSEKVPCPVFVTALAAAKRGLDFMAITDHNTLSHAHSVRELQPYFNPMLLLVGREITTFFGHANVFGTLADINFQVVSQESDSNRLLQDVAAQKGLISINHPVRPSGELCMGCGWNNQTDWKKVQAIEVVNGADVDTIFSGVPFWHSQLNAGHYITGISGSDNHQPDQEKPNYTGRVGQPSTVVFASELSQNAIINAVRQGHAFIDITGSNDKLLEITAQSSGGEKAMMGDRLQAAKGTNIQLRIQVKNAAGSNVQLWKDGKKWSLDLDNHITRNDQTIETSWSFDGDAHWLRADVQDQSGKTIMIGNPIYLHSK